MSKNTRGPWEVRPDESGVTYLRVRGSQLGCRFRIANVPKLTYEGATESEAAETLANANLIAAAPELLEALRFILDRYVQLVNSGDAGFWDPEKEPQVIQSRAAMAKAEGK
jgi:hypothetical protein